MPHPYRMVAHVSVSVGQPYIPILLFPQSGWGQADESMGIVISIGTIKW